MTHKTNPTSLINNADGLTKREYFAALALQGMLSYYGRQSISEIIAEESVNFADALIVELNKEKENDN